MTLFTTLKRMRLTDKENKLVRGNETQGGSTKKKKSPMKRGENIGWVLNRHILVLSETRNWNCTTNVGCRRKVNGAGRISLERNLRTRTRVAHGLLKASPKRKIAPTGRGHW